MIIKCPNNQPGGMWPPPASPSRREIARITFADGSTVSFPSSASGFECPGGAQAAVTPRAPGASLSPVTNVGRNRSESLGTDLSSTDGAREAFGGLSFKPSLPIEIPSNRRPDSSPEDYPPDGLAAAAWDCTDYVGFGEECSSAARLPHGGSAQYSIKSDRLEWSSDLQTQLVADADGPSLSQGYAWPPLDDMSFATNDFTDELDPPDAFLAVESPGQSKQLSTSAPAATSWMQQRGKGGPNTFARSVLPAVSSYAFGRSHSRLEPNVLERTARKPGRQPGSRLPEEKRKKVALMRMIGACEYCKSGRRGCDPGTPCRPCVLHFGPELLKEPNYCRRSIIDTLLDLLLSPALSPHSQDPPLEGSSAWDCLTTGWSVDMPLQLGSGPPLRRRVQVVDVLRSRPAPAAASGAHLLPVVFADNGDLLTSIDRHVSARVNQHFAQFNGRRTGIRVLDDVYALYCYYRQASQVQDYAALLHQALKLLFLTHDLTLSVDAADPVVSRVLAQFAPGHVRGQPLNPYFLQAEVGKVVPQLARTLLADVLQRLLRTCLSRRCDQHPLVLAVFAVLMMSIESITHHIAETSCSVKPTASSSPTHTSLSTPIAALVRKEEGASILLNLYRNCFENCHRILLRPMEAQHLAALQKTYGSAPAQFLGALSELIRDAGDYLERIGGVSLEDIQTPSQYFDRQVARLLLLQSR